MDTNSYLILGISAILILLGLRGGEGEQGFRFARLERKVDALLKKFDIDPQAGIDPEVLAFAKAGRKIEAIKRYRQATGVSLKEAKDYVEEVERSSRDRQ